MTELFDRRLSEIGMTRTALATRLGVTRASLHNWARRTRRVSPHHVASLCEALGVEHVGVVGMIPLGSQEATARRTDGPRAVAWTPLLERIQRAGYKGYSDYARTIGVCRPNVERWAKRALSVNAANTRVLVETLGLDPGEVYRLVLVRGPRLPRCVIPPVVGVSTHAIQRHGSRTAVDKTNEAMASLYAYAGTQPGR